MLRDNGAASAVQGRGATISIPEAIEAGRVIFGEILKEN
jgi:hypothetical protein